MHVVDHGLKVCLVGMQGRCLAGDDHGAKSPGPASSAAAAPGPTGSANVRVRLHHAWAYTGGIIRMRFGVAPASPGGSQGFMSMC